MKGVKKFGEKEKLSPRYAGPYRFLSRVWKVDYEIELPAELSVVHPLFHGSMLRKCIGDLVVAGPCGNPDSVEGATWEAEEDMQAKYPHLFSANLEKVEAGHLKRDEENGYQVTPKGNTVIHVATLYGHSYFVREVLKITPALLCCQNKKNETALHIVDNEGHTEVALVLLACLRDHNTKEKLTSMTDASGDTALHKAMRSQHLDVVKLFVKEDSEFEFPPNHAQETPLYLEAESGFHDALINILESCKKPTHAAGPSNRTPLHAAVIQEHRVYLLAGSENDWTTAIHIAASEGYVYMINKLLNKFPDCWDMLNRNDQNALHVAVFNNQDNIVHFLLNSDKCNCLVDEPDSDGNTPLHLLAATGNHLPELINHPRAKMMSFNKENQTPLDMCMTHSDNKERKRPQICF
ncbi:putative ankyrin repeat-containing protein-like [Capsicum annuum]|nr:putative ankyrin repeat-containing protein-like [Capsicum annuum]KAF3659499.1 putative ankyrin repeat-containing protein-like [Capsicum annuum]